MYFVMLRHCLYFQKKMLPKFPMFTFKCWLLCFSNIPGGCGFWGVSVGNQSLGYRSRSNEDLK